MGKNKQQSGMGFGVDSEEEEAQVPPPACSAEDLMDEGDTSPPCTAAAPAACSTADEGETPPPDGRPLCPVHAKPMEAYSSNNTFTYYRCAEPGCTKTDKRVRRLPPLKNKYGNRTK